MRFATSCISIHAPLAGRDLQCATLLRVQKISIHAPLAGRDLLGGSSEGQYRHFNPRAPRGARLNFYPLPVLDGLFQSTRPSRGATPTRALPRHGQTISIHAPLAGRDARAIESGTTWMNFNPRAPRGARPCTCSLVSRQQIFQSTRPSRGAT